MEVSNNNKLMEVSNYDKLIDCFCRALDIENDKVNDDLKYQGIPEWDSMSHMFLISELEEEFDIEIDTDDVIDMSSFAKSREILSKYDISFE